MLHGGAFQVCQDVSKTGNEKWDHFPRVPCVRSPLPPFPASLAQPLTMHLLVAKYVHIFLHS